MKILPLPSNFTTFTPKALCHCYWCPIFLPLVCHTVCQLTLQNMQVFFHVTNAVLGRKQTKWYYGMLTVS